MRTTRKKNAASGAAGELIVGADLMTRGYQVFRNLAPTGIDILAYRDGRVVKVEVKTAYRRKDGSWIVPTVKAEYADIVACVNGVKTAYFTPGRVALEP